MARILILGATSPIARELALRFAAEGSTLYLAARDAGEAARIAADITVRARVAVRSGAFEAGAIETHRELIARASAEMDGLDGVVLCFGTLGDEELSRHDPAEAARVVGDNFTGAVSLLTIAAERLEAQRSGFIIVLGSVAGDRGRQKNYVYGSAKGALALFAQGLRGRLASASVDVLTVKLGLVDTRMTWGRPGVFLSVAPARAAARIHAAWQRRTSVIYVPGWWRLIMAAVKLIPEPIFKRLNF